MLSTLLLLLLLLLCCRWWRRRRLVELAERMPGPPCWPLFGNALVFMAHPANQLNIIHGFIKKYGEHIRFWLGPELMVVVENPSDIRLLLTSNKINLKGPMYEFMKVFVGPGVLSEGGWFGTLSPVWRSHRKIATPSYSKKTVQGYAKVFNDSAKELVEVLSKKDANETFNVYHSVVENTTLSVCRTIIGLSKEESKCIKSMDVFVKETSSMYDFVFTNMTHFWYHIPLIFWLSGRKKKENYYKRIMDEMTSDMLARRRRALAENKISDEELGVVDRYILSGELTDQEIKWETITFFTASQEASAKIASMVLLILAHLQEWQDKVYKEITELIGDEEFVSDDHLKQLSALDMVYKEAIRLMPIAAFIQRTVEEEVTIKNGSITLPKGATVVIPIYAVHRDPKYWDEPNLVKPERFLPENARRRDPNAYIPFSLGAMDCIGRVFAESMIKTLVVHVVRSLSLSAEGRIEDLELNVAISVKFQDGYNLRVKPRRPVLVAT